MTRNISYGRGGAGKSNYPRGEIFLSLWRARAPQVPARIAELSCADPPDLGISRRAGNIAPQQRPATPKDLVTPTIKQEVYTTGRGGSGNMVQNDPQHPELARESQDVESPPLRAEQFPHHTGRGMESPFCTMHTFLSTSLTMVSCTLNLKHSSGLFFLFSGQMSRLGAKVAGLLILDIADATFC